MTDCVAAKIATTGGRVCSLPTPNLGMAVLYPRSAVMRVLRAASQLLNLI